MGLERDSASVASRHSDENTYGVDIRSYSDFLSYDIECCVTEISSQAASLCYRRTIHCAVTRVFESPTAQRSRAGPVSIGNNYGEMYTEPLKHPLLRAKSTAQTPTIFRPARALGF